MQQGAQQGAMAMMRSNMLSVLTGEQVLIEEPEMEAIGSSSAYNGRKEERKKSRQKILHGDRISPIFMRCPTIDIISRGSIMNGDRDKTSQELSGKNSTHWTGEQHR
jgi:hypothetical protein